MVKIKTNGVTRSGVKGNENRLISSNFSFVPPIHQAKLIVGRPNEDGIVGEIPVQERVLKIISGQRIHGRIINYRRKAVNPMPDSIITDQVRIEHWCIICSKKSTVTKPF